MCIYHAWQLTGDNRPMPLITTPQSIHIKLHCDKKVNGAQNSKVLILFQLKYKL